MTPPNIWSYDKCIEHGSLPEWQRETVFTWLPKVRTSQYTTSSYLCGPPSYLCGLFYCMCGLSLESLPPWLLYPKKKDMHFNFYWAIGWVWSVWILMGLTTKNKSILTTKNKSIFYPLHDSFINWPGKCRLSEQRSSSIETFNYWVGLISWQLG